MPAIQEVQKNIKNWHSLDYYASLNYIIISFLSQIPGNKINVTSITGEITLQNRNWVAMITAYRILIWVSVTISVVALITFLYLYQKRVRYQKKMKRKAFYAKLNRNGMSNNEYIARLEQALEE